MQERKACAVLKARFEAAGFHIAENQPFDQGGVRFEIDGIDPERKVGYEYVTDEAGDSWDVDGEVVAELAARMARGELYILVVDETKAPDEASLGAAIDGFLGELKTRKVLPAAPKAAKSKPKAVKAPKPAKPTKEAKAKPAAKRKPRG